MAPSCSPRSAVTRRGPLTIGIPLSKRLMGPDSTNRQDEASLKVTVEWAEVARATCRQLSRLVADNPQLTTIRFCRVDSSNDRQPAFASVLTAIGGGVPVSISRT